MVMTVTSQPLATNWFAVSRIRYAQLFAAGGNPMAR